MSATDDADVVRAHWVTRDAVLAAIAGAGADLVALLRSLPAADAERPVPHLDWTVAETAAHVVTIGRRALADRRRVGSIAELATLNDTTIAEVAERDPDALADLVAADLATLATLAPGVPDDIAVRLHAGVRADVTSALSYLLTDLVVHGWDVATATGRPWPIDSHRAAVTLLAVLPGLRPWLRTEVADGPPVVAAFRLAGEAEPLVARAGDGRYEIGRTAGAGIEVADAEAADLLLTLAGRTRSANDAVTRYAAWYLPL